MNVGDRFVSNRGEGPWVAVIVAVTPSVAHLERWDRRLQHGWRVPFSLPLWFLESGKCGWRPA